MQFILVFVVKLLNSAPFTEIRCLIGSGGSIGGDGGQSPAIMACFCKIAGFKSADADKQKLELATNVAKRVGKIAVDRSRERSPISPPPWIRHWMNLCHTNGMECINQYGKMLMVQGMTPEAYQQPFAPSRTLRL